MREGLVILVVIVILLALTALRYRKQINTMIGMAKVLKEVNDQAVASKTMPAEKQSVQLVNCAKCGVWVPQTKAVGRNGMFYCSTECSLAKARA